ncbi:type IV toxin-antitoxin system AbiEi family antitoxin domain-containing protein [Sanguibacter sp. A247]|uniref:type IV toxin-antitoxin system AbiEi family antitoxin domain-containing protein n=1 Tax=unclassified Sanguibacter TaxID=2645534 RepID=UPI003FD7D18A
MIALEEVVDLAADQWGLVTAAQAERLGVPRHHLTSAVASGRMERISYGVYAMAGVPDSHLTRLRAAYLSVDPAATLAERGRQLPSSGVVSHASAAVVHNLGTLRALQHEITFPAQRRTTRRELKFHTMKLGPASITQVDGLPVTTIERTAADLLRSGADEDHVSRILMDAIRRDALNRPRLVRELAPVAKRHGLDPVEWAASLAPAPSLERLLSKHYLAHVPMDKVMGAAGQDYSSSLTPKYDASMFSSMMPKYDDDMFSGLVPDDPVIRARLREAGKAARRALEDLAADSGVPVSDLVGPMLRAGGLDG